ncbi:MAG: peptidoglycan DD-metalloendopeptidase family protein [Thermodesulfobacteriota bacterium]
MKAALLFLPLIFIPVSIAASDGNKPDKDIVRQEKKLEDVKKKLDETEKAVKRISKKETTVLEEIEKANKAIRKSREELKKIDSSIAALGKEVSVAEAKVSGLTAEKRLIEWRLRSRLTAIYRMRNGGMLRFIPFDEPAGAGRRYRYMTAIMESDARLMERAEVNISELASGKERLQGLLLELGSGRNIASLRKNDAEEAFKNKRSLLSRLKKEKESSLNLAKELEGAKSELMDVIANLEKDEETAALEKSGFAAMKGRLKPPVTGRVVSFYGKVVHPKFNTVTFNNGILIEAAYGTPVKNVYKGKVAYIGWLKGYGQVMIIEHGGGFYTLFAHISETMRGKGSIVAGGETVALVGDSGAVDTAGLYFEVRRKGVPSDPLAWIDRKAID